MGSPPATQPEHDPRSYTPKHLADKILQSKSALEGERKQVTVMFADVKGSMELAEQLDPEEWHRILDRFFQILTEGVHRFEGTVNQYTGDGIMALFGAPIAHEDHARRACYSALWLQEGLRKSADQLRRTQGLNFSVRIGLNSGEVVVGKIGDDLRMDYTAQGHTVGLAQRMEALASGGSIYLSARTAGLVSGYLDLKDLGDFAVKGSTRPLRVFELRGSGDARTPFDLARARGLTRFVGRSDEMAVLEVALEQALAGRGRTIGIVAQAGTGKTRLCHEFGLRCRARGLTVHEARGLAHGKNIALLPAVELLRNFFGIDERDGDRAAREKITGRVLFLDESLRDELPIFFDLLGVPDPVRPLPPVDPEALQRRMYNAVRAIMRADADWDPGVVLLEDLHWLDPASDAVFEQVIEAIAASRSLVVVNFRPEYRARWMQQSHYQQLSLLPLSESALRDLLRDLLGEDSSVAALPAAIHARTGGNPFFSEEVVQSMIEDGHLEGTRGAYRLLADYETLPIPESVQGVLAARIDRLPEREKHVLQAASVVGTTFGERVLARVVDLPEIALTDALRNLQDGEFLYEVELYPEREYTFKHPLTQEVADRSQLSERRKSAHAAVARAIEELDAQHLDERAALLAHHWEGADDPARAAHWHARAAGRIGATDYGDAYAHWRRVEELLEEVGSNGEMQALRARALVEQVKLAFRAGITEKDAAALYQRGRDYLEARGDDRALAELLCAFAAIKQNLGDLIEYSELAEEAAATARRAGDPVLRAAVTLDLVWTRMQRGSLAEAVAAADEGVALVGDDSELGADVFGWSPLAANLGAGGFALALMGRVEEADQRVSAALRVAPDRSPLEILTWLHSWRTEVELSRGNADQALHAGRRCLELAEGSGSPHCSVFAHCWLAAAHVAHQSWREAADLMEKAGVLSRETQAGLDALVLSSWVLPAAYLGLGEIERARALADEAIEVCRAQRTPVYLCRALLARAAVFRSDLGGDVARAQADLDAAERLVEETGARRFLPAILEERARLATDAARERHLREAHRLYTEMGAVGHAARVGRELGLPADQT